MKKILVLSILTVFLFSCASSRNNERLSDTDNPVSLETAIELAAVHIADGLKPGSRIAIVDFESENDNLSHHIMEELTGELLKHRIEVADRQNLPYIFQEFELQMSGAVSDETSQSLGKIIGAEFVIVGRLLDIVTMYRNHVDTVQVERATRESAARHNVRKDRELQRMITTLANQQTTVKVYRYGVTEQTRPETAGIFLDRGIMYAVRGEYDKAIADFDEAIKINPNFVAAYIMRGHVLFATVSTVLETDEKFENVFYSFTRLGGNGRASPEQSSVIDKAIADYTKAIQLDPNFVKTYNNRAIMYLFKGDTDRAFSDFSQIIQRFPNDGAAYFNRGHIYSDKKDYDRAIVDYTEAIRLTPNVPSWGYNSRGNAYQFGKGDYDHAIADYTQAIRIDPINGPYYGRGRAYWFKKEYDQALLDLNQAIRLNPNGTEALTTRGTVYAVGKRDLNRAIADWEAVLRIDPNHKAAKENLELAREMLGR